MVKSFSRRVFLEWPESLDSPTRVMSRGSFILKGGALESSKASTGKIKEQSRKHEIIKTRKIKLSALRRAQGK
jgi:hypothetical protein